MYYTPYNMKLFIQVHEKTYFFGQTLYVYKLRKTFILLKITKIVDPE